MKKIFILIFITLSIIGWSQDSITLTSKQYTTFYLNSESNDWEEAETFYGDCILSITNSTVKIKHLEEVHFEYHNILKQGVEDSDKVIYTSFNKVNYKFVFPYKNSKVVIVYTLERSGESYELFYYKLD